MDGMNCGKNGEGEFGRGLRSIRRRRRYVWGIIAVYLPVMWGALRVSSFHAASIAFGVWLLLLCICVFAAALCRCPACGNYFHMHGLTLLFCRRCLHCNLHLNADRRGESPPAPTAVTSPSGIPPGTRA